MQSGLWKQMTAPIGLCLLEPELLLALNRNMDKDVSFDLIQQAPLYLSGSPECHVCYQNQLDILPLTSIWSRKSSIRTSSSTGGR